MFVYVYKDGKEDSLSKISLLYHHQREFCERFSYLRDERLREPSPNPTPSPNHSQHGACSESELDREIFGPVPEAALEFLCCAMS